MSVFRCLGRTKVSVYGRGTCSCFVTKSVVTVKELLAPRPTPKLEDHPSSADRDCLFNIFAATLPIGHSSFIRNLRTRHAVVTRTHLSRLKNQDHRKFSELKIICLRRKKKCIVDTFVSSLRTQSASITESIFIIFQDFKQLLMKLCFSCGFLSHVLIKCFDLEEPTLLQVADPAPWSD
jgi:hypothetical protein